MMHLFYFWVDFRSFTRVNTINMDKVTRFLNPATAAEQPQEQNAIMSEVRKCTNDLKMCTMFRLL